jgi:hypothetical protein
MQNPHGGSELKLDPNAKPGDPKLQLKMNQGG